MTPARATTPAARRRRPRTTAVDLHRAWLAGVDTDGPFLAVPVARGVWPQGMPQLEPERKAVLLDVLGGLEPAWDRWDRARGMGGSSEAALAAYRRVRDVFVETVLREVVGWAELYLPGTRGVRVSSPDSALVVEPTGALVHGDTVGALILVVDPVASLRDAPGDGWAASAVDRMEALLRAADVAVGVVTDGRWWALVHVGPEAMPASGVVDALEWVSAPEVRNAFVELLGRGRLVAGPVEERLPRLFRDSVAAAEDITVALGVQVRRAVELLVAAFSEAADRAGERGEPSPLPEPGAVYDAAVTVMMRVVFLLFAEERGLLPEGELFVDGYGIAGALDDLTARRTAEGPESLDGTSYVWHRLLSTSLALHRGATFEDLRLPAYGGSLFDPQRFPFLLARAARGGLAVTVPDRVLYHVLHSVQYAVVSGEARRVSFREVDVEQIGYVYEGLLGYTCRPATEVVVGLRGREGEEPELALSVLEEYAAGHGSPAGLAAALLETVKQEQPGAKPQTRAALAKALQATPEHAETRLRAVAPLDAGLRERLRPFLGAVRDDLRGRPVLVRPGGLLLVETPSRRNAGAHYTPRSLAEEVVEHALAPLVYSPGPHDTGERDRWRLRSSDEILDLKVADIACGSGAFLVAAARYLADRLLEAWQRQGEELEWSAHEARVHAVRKVVASCLYGADINAMAVEMCKLSLWLVSLDRDLPFSFVDDKVLHGNSLLGLTSLRQLESLHVTPKAARAGGEQQRWDLARGGTELIERLDVGPSIARATRLRRELASEVVPHDPQRGGDAKRRQLARSREAVAPLSRIADGVVAAGLPLGGKPGKRLDEAYQDLRIAVAAAVPGEGKEPDPTWLEDLVERGLTPSVETDYPRWQPLHWCLAVPDVMERAAGRAGFDAVVGNPPFLGGQKLTGAVGEDVRGWLVATVAHGRRGSADLVAYFFLRTVQLLNDRGTLGLLATNTVAQGDTREVGLDQMVARGFTITRAVQSRSWPAASVNLEYAAVWGTVGPVGADAPRVCDGFPTRRIATLLEPTGRVDGPPLRLRENAGIAFIGCYVLGMGFILDPEEAADWIARDPRNAEVLFPYLNGADLNSRPDCSPSRWVIDFTGMSLDESRTYPLPSARVLERVKPERAKNNRDVYRRDWWQFAEKRPALRTAVSALDEVLVVALVSKTVMPVRVPTGPVFSHMLGVFATQSFADQGVLSSSLHQLWAITYGSGMRNDPRYTPSDVFDTFPRPAPSAELECVGQVLDEERREVMLRRGLGLTSLYNLVNDPDLPGSADADVDRMRQIHRDIDEVVMAAYGWDDVPLGHGFHTYRQMTRWTVSPAARVEILDRLLEENHRRAALQDGPGEEPS